jgi:hypothetical protein
MKKIKYTVIDDDVFSDSKPGVKTQLNNNNNNFPNATNINTSINNNFSIKSQIYQAVSNIYKNFLMTKTTQYQTYGVYKALVESNIHTDMRYLVAIVENDNKPLGTEIPLYELNWVSFQTRSTKNAKEFKQFNMSPYSYVLPNKSILHDRITKILETKEKTVYSTDNLPITIEVIHMNENDTFTDKGTVIAALELYQTIMTFNE